MSYFVFPNLNENLRIKFLWPYTGTFCITSPYPHELCHEKIFFLNMLNKGTDQLCCNRAAHQCLCFGLTLLPKSEISSLSSYLLWLCSMVCVGPWRFLAMQLIDISKSYLNCQATCC